MIPEGSHLTELFDKERIKDWPVKALIFDLDGLLVDTEELWWETYRQVCYHYGVILSEEQREEMVGRGKISLYLIKELGINDSVESLQTRISQVYHRLFDHYFRPMPGAIETVKRFSPLFSIAVGTSARAAYGEWLVEKLGFKEKVRVVVGGDQVERTKPFPDIFLEVARKLEVTPQSCLVFEDSPNGLKAAKAAEMFCLVVPNRFLPKSDYSTADLILPSLEGIDLEVIGKLSK